MLRGLYNSRVAKQQAIVDKAKAEKRDMTADEKKEFDSLQEEINTLAKALENAPGQKELENKNDGSRQVEDERKRASEITELCRQFDMNAKKFIDEGKTVEEVRAAILDEMIKNGAPIGTRGQAQVTDDAEDKFRRAASDALLMRGGIKLEKPADGAKDMMGMTLRDLAIESLASCGETNLNRRSSDELYSMLSRGFYNPTAAFPAILDNAINKAYVQGYNQAPSTFDLWTTKGTLTDFKANQHNYLAGSAGEFLEVPENGELQADAPNDTQLPSRQLRTYGRQFTMSRQAFINDDIGFLSTVPARYAASAKRTTNNQVYKILVDNPIIYDGVALFSSTHKNLVTIGTAPTEAEVKRVVTALGLHKDPFGKAITIRPAFFIVPVGYAMDMYAIFNSPTMNTSGNTQAVNPLFNLKNQVQVLEEPTLNAMCDGNVLPWFCVANGADCNSIQVDYLNGDEIPKIRRSEQSGTLGFIWDIYLDWGITVMDYRGIVKNPGTQSTFSL